MAFIPSVGLKGVYRFSPPFDRIWDECFATCQGHRTIQSYIAERIDPYLEIYKPYDIDEATFTQEKNNNVTIAIFQAESGGWFLIPTTYIVGPPETDGVIYQAKALAISVGVIPANKDLTGIKQLISDILKDTLGITPSIAEQAVSGERLVSFEDHAQIETTLNALKQRDKTDRVRYLELVTVHQATLAKLQALENYVVNHLPP